MFSFTLPRAGFSLWKYQMFPNRRIKLEPHPEFKRQISSLSLSFPCIIQRAIKSQCLQNQCLQILHHRTVNSPFRALPICSLVPTTMWACRTYLVLRVKESRTFGNSEIQPINRAWKRETFLTATQQSWKGIYKD